MDHVDELVAAWRAELPQAATVELEIVKRVAWLKGRLGEVTQSVLGEHGLTYADFDVLATLLRSGTPYRLKPSRLASNSALTTGGTSNILQRLTAAGLVEREPDPADGRSSWVRLTQEGVRLTGELVAATTEANGVLFGNVPAATARALADLLREVVLALGDGPGAAPPATPRRRSAG
ncbi:MarR family transcriptional regulator [Planomonospora venezuelensis]|nr:MarR family transcriptional regulator [Planomonospora venezuelensis]